MGGVIGSQLAGRLMDRDFRITVRDQRRKQNIDPSVDIGVKKAKTSADFPLEHARFRNIWIATIVLAASVGVYGLSFETHISVPIIVLFIIALSHQIVFNIVSTLAVDLYPESSASATATNNLVRCSLGALGTSIIAPIIQKVGRKWAFGILAAITLLTIPLAVVEWLYGQDWRAKRMEAQEQADE